ncbi:MAG: hypothetical protein GY822_00910 [Deltaproteobacteria bacterium]|nr:hypothetical protein [Deltaproteobacteria bacterium]
MLRLPSDTFQGYFPAKDGLHKKLAGTLTVKCSEKSGMEVSIGYLPDLRLPEAVAGDESVEKLLVQFGKEKPQAMSWHHTKDGWQLLRESRIRFLKDAMGHDDFKVLLKDGRMFDFDVRGMPKAMAPLQKACGW